MAFKFSTEIRRQQCFSGSLKSILDGCVIRFYSGPIPSGPDSALAGNDLLCEITAGGDPLTFETGSTTPTLTKNLSEIWQGNAVKSGYATFFRMVKQSDTGTNSTSEVRIQGTVGGPADDLTISNPTFVNGSPQRIEYFAIAVLEYA